MRLPLATSVITSTASANVASSTPRCFTASRWKRTQTPQLFIADTMYAMSFLVLRSSLPGDMTCL